MMQFLCCPGHYLGREQDGAFYVLAARAILRGAYTLGISPGEPALTFITPGWPLLLSPAAALSGDAALGYQLWAWAWLVLATGLAFVWFRRRFGSRPAYLLTALFALNPLVLSRSGVLTSEIPFLALTFAILLRLEKASPAETGLSLGFLWLVRPAALAFFPAVWAARWLLAKGDDRWKALVPCATLSFVPPALWWLWVRSAGGTLSEVREIGMSLPGQGLGGLALIAAANARSALSLLGETLLPWAPSGSMGFALILGAVFAAFAIYGAARSLRRGYEPAAALLAGGALMHAFWPWWYERYLVVFLPFLLWGLWEAVRSLRRESLAAGLLVLVLVLSLAGQGRLVARQSARSHRLELHASYRWIQRHTPAHALIASALYARDAFYTGRPFVPLPTGGGDLAERLRRGRIAYVLWREVPDLGSTLGKDFFWTRRLAAFGAEIAAAEGRSIKREHFDPLTGTALFRVEPGL